MVTKDDQGTGDSLSQGSKSLGSKQVAFDAEVAAIAAAIKWFCTSYQCFTWGWNGGRIKLIGIGWRHVKSLLHMREMDEQLFRQLHGLHEVLQERNVPEGELRFVVENWMQQVRQTMQPLTNVHPGEIVNNRHR